MEGLKELWDLVLRIPRFLLWFFTNNATVAAAGAVFLAAGIYVRHSPRFGDYKDGVGALCDALVIAAFLKLTVDPVLKRELTKEAAKDVFLYAYGYSLPAKLRRFVNDLVLETKVVRQQCHLRWQISPKTDDPEKLEVNLDASFSIVNFSGGAVRYQHKVYSWKEKPEDPGCVRAMYCEPKNPKDAKYRKEDANGLTKDKDGYIRGNAIRLRPHSKKDQYRIGAVYFTEAERSGLDQFGIMEPTMEITVTVVADHSLGDLMFSVVPDPSGTKGNENYVFLELHPETKQLQRSWNLRRVFVPNERVLIRWKKMEVPALQFKSVS